MKKYRVLCLSILSLFLVSCGQIESNKIKVLIPNGSPALSALYLMEDEGFEVEVVSGAQPLQAALLSNTYDVVFAPTNLGAKLYNKAEDPQFIFLGTVVWGNNYLVTTNKSSFTLADLENKEIIAHSQNNTPDAILKYVLSGHQLDATVTYKTNVAEAQAYFLQHQESIVLLSEPQVSVVKTKVPSLQIIDLQVAYQALTGEDSYPQAGVFVRKDLGKNTISKIEKAIDDSVKKVLSDVEKAADLAVSLELGFPKRVLIEAIPSSHLEYKTADRSKAALVLYFEQLLLMDPTMLEGRLPDDAFYFKP